MAVPLAALLALALLPCYVLGGAPTMWLQPVVDIDPLAVSTPVEKPLSEARARHSLSSTAQVCNDGSPAGYYVIPATTQPDVFLLYLEGGMCVARCLTTGSLLLLLCLRSTRLA